MSQTIYVAHGGSVQWPDLITVTTSIITLCEQINAFIENNVCEFVSVKSFSDGICFDEVLMETDDEGIVSDILTPLELAELLSSYYRARKNERIP